MVLMLVLNVSSFAKCSASTMGVSKGVAKGLAPRPTACARSSADWMAQLSASPANPEATRYLSGPVAFEVTGFTISTDSKRRVVRNNSADVEAENAVYSLQTNLPPWLRHDT